MQTLAQQMAVYAAYHRDPRNRLTHYFGVPLIIFAILIPLGWVRVAIGGVEPSAAMVFAGVVLAYYYRLDVVLALAMSIVVVLLLAASESVAAGMSLAQGGLIFAVTFLLGWTLQLVGHAFEGRRPALVDNFWQIFVAPIFLMAELFFKLGYRLSVQEEMRRSGRCMESRGS